MVKQGHVAEEMCVWLINSVDIPLCSAGEWFCRETLRRT